MSQSHIPRGSRPEVISILADNLLVWICLYTNDVPIADNVVLANFIEASFNGYARFKVGHWTPGMDRDGVGVTFGDPAFFTWDGTGVVPTVRGYFALQAPAGGLLWWWQAPGDGLTLTAAQPMLMVVPRLNLREQPIV